MAASVALACAVILAGCSGHRGGEGADVDGASAQVSGSAPHGGGTSARVSGSVPHGGGTVAQPESPSAAGKTTQTAQSSSAGAAGGVAASSGVGGSTGASGGAEAPTASDAYVSFVRGTVTADGTAVRIADPVTAGETLVTDKGSSVEVRIGSDFDVGLGERTSVTFGLPGKVVLHTNSGRPLRLRLSLTEGSVLVKAGGELVTQAPSQSDVTAGSAQRSLLLEIRGPRLFVTSRGGSLLLAADVDSSLCAVGLGEGWVVPRSVVYSDLAERLANPDALRALDGILTKSVPLRRHEQVTVSTSQLADIDKIGSSLGELLVANKDRILYPTSTKQAFNQLVEKATAAIAEAIGKPQPLTAALRSELDPASIYHQTMKTTATSESSPSRSSSTSTTGSSASGSTGSASTSAGSKTSGTAPAGAPSSTTSSGFPGPTAPTPPTPPTVPQ